MGIVGGAGVYGAQDGLRKVGRFLKRDGIHNGTAGMGLHSASNLSPKLLATVSGFGRIWNHLRVRIFPGRGLESVPQVVPRLPIALGGYDQGRASDAGEKLQQLPIPRLGRNIYVNQHYT